jgi:SAM-dependent methyltransferase
MRRKIILSIVVVLILFVVLFPSAAKKCTPGFVKSYIKDLLGITELQEHIKVLETIVYEKNEEVWKRSRQRWENAKPEAGLSWGKEISGDAFIEKAAQYKAFGKDKVVLEIGPGYGRLLSSMLDKKIEFKKYIGVDISKDVCSFLQKKFARPDIEIINGDAEKIILPEQADVVISALTFKHMYPDFEQVILNLNKSLKPGGLYIFDLLEGEGKYFENDGQTYIHKYTKDEVKGILSRCSLDLVTFDEVQHDADHKRLLVVARKK